MSAFRGILTGYGMAAIKNKEAKDNAKMEVVKAAGLDYHTNQLPAHKKAWKLIEHQHITQLN
jgi:hypothetical protein